MKVSVYMKYTSVYMKLYLQRADSLQELQTKTKNKRWLNRTGSIPKEKKIKVTLEQR